MGIENGGLFWTRCEHYKTGKKNNNFLLLFFLLLCYFVSVGQNVIKQSGYNVKIVNACAVNVKAHIDIRVKLDKFGHQVTSDTNLHTVIIQMRRLLMSRLIRIFSVCLEIYFYSYI